MTEPGLWLLGDQGRIILSREKAQIVRDIADQLGKPFTVVVYPDGRHGLRDADSGDRIDFWADLLPWLDSGIQ